MLKINGAFKIWEMKTIKTKSGGEFKVIKVSHSHKNKDGSYTNSYYDIPVNDKLKDSGITNGMIKDKAFVEIEGYLMINVGNFTNLTLYPKSVKLFERNPSMSDKINDEDSLPF